MSGYAMYECSCGAKKVASPLTSIDPFVTSHFSRRHVVRKITGGEGYPVVRRFVIRRHALTTSTNYPWVLRDRKRPAYLGHYATLDLALAAIRRKIAEERSDYIPSRREIREAMSTGGAAFAAEVAHS